MLVFLLLAFLSLVPFYPEDIDFYAGGLTGPTFPQNTLGMVGAYFGWFCLMTFGLAAYPLLVVATICCLRRLLWRHDLRPGNWAYYLCIPLSGLGFSFLLGIWPDAFQNLTTSLNISRFPGGVIGDFLCAGPNGLIYNLLSPKGCMIVGALILCLSFCVIWMNDWHDLFMQFWNVYSQNRKTAKSAVDETFQTMESAPMQADEFVQPPQGNAPVAQPAPMPQPEMRYAQNAQVGGVLNSRRGEASILRQQQFAQSINGTQRPTYDPVAVQPTRRQPELPVQPQRPTAQQPQRPVQPAAPRQLSANDGSNYVLPDPLAVYKPTEVAKQQSAIDQEIQENSEIIQNTLDAFNVDADVVNAIPGPQVTLYEIQMGHGIPLKTLNGHQDDLSSALCSRHLVRMLLPIPGKDRAGIEVPNRVREIVGAHELFASPSWQDTRMKIPLMLGKNVDGDVIMMDLAKAPHLLVAGATGTGKSVCMNLMIQSMLLHFSPTQLKLIMFDPKFLEFAPYSKIPHLLAPIINEPKEVGPALNWACVEMDRRYIVMKEVGVKNLAEFNSRPESPEPQYDENGELIPRQMPYLVIIIDELADIMAVAKKDVEGALARLAGKARAAGIHMIVATQRPSADVITGLIKSNFPYRIALQVTDQVNSRVILGTKGAEDLLGQGDMLMTQGGADMQRIQCGWVTNEEIAEVASICSSQAEQSFNESIMRAIANTPKNGENAEGGEAGGEYGGFDDDSDPNDNSTDTLVRKALAALETGKRPTISYLQRALRIGYNKSADLMQELEDRGYVGPQPISGLREIYWDNFPSRGGHYSDDADDMNNSNSASYSDDSSIPPSDETSTNPNLPNNDSISN
ncbi:MAG: DNA translocase FtsK [Lentisphaeria bacterium]|nr:DNA translocase FtsK [Lentisphaeria bacterium]